MTSLQKMKTSHDDSLLKIDRISIIVGIDEVACLNEHNNETWHVQVSLFEFSFPLRNFFNISLDVSDKYLLHFLIEDLMFDRFQFCERISKRTERR